MNVYEDTTGAIVSASGTTKEEYRSTTINVSTNTSLSGAIVDPTESSKKGITLNIYLHASSLEDDPQDLSDTDYSVYIGLCDDYTWKESDGYGWWDWNDDGKKVTPNSATGEGLMTVKNDGEYDYLSITLTDISLNVGIVLYYLAFEANGLTEFDWSHEIENLSFDISKYDENGCTYTLDVVSYHDDLGGWVIPDTSGETYETMDITIVTINAGNSSTISPYCTDCSSWTASSMSSISNTDYASYGSSGHYYTFSNHAKNEDLTFIISTDSTYWSHSIVPSTNVIGSQSNYMFWSYSNGASSTSGSQMGLSLSYLTTDISTIQELIVILSFDYADFSTSQHSTTTMTVSFATK